MSFHFDVNKALSGVNMNAATATRLVNLTLPTHEIATIEPFAAISKELVKVYDEINVGFEFLNHEKPKDKDDPTQGSHKGYTIAKKLDARADFIELRLLANNALYVTDQNHRLWARTDANNRAFPETADDYKWHFVKQVKEQAINIMAATLIDWFTAKDFQSIQLIETLLTTARGRPGNVDPAQLTQFINFAKILWTPVINEFNQFVVDPTSNNMKYKNCAKNRQFYYYGLAETSVTFTAANFKPDLKSLDAVISHFVDQLNGADQYELYRSKILSQLPRQNNGNSNNSNNNASNSNNNNNPNSGASVGASVGAESEWSSNLARVHNVGGNAGNNYGGNRPVPTLLERLNSKSNQRGLAVKVRERRSVDRSMNVNIINDNFNQDLVNNANNIQDNVRNDIKTNNKAALVSGLTFMHPGIENEEDHINFTELINEYGGNNVTDKDIQKAVMTNYYQFMEYRKDQIELNDEINGNLSKKKRTSAQISYYRLCTTGGAPVINILRYFALIGEINWSRDHTNIDSAINVFMKEKDATYKTVLMISTSISELAELHRTKDTTNEKQLAATIQSAYLHIAGLQWMAFAKFIQKELSANLYGTEGLKALNHFLLKRRKAVLERGNSAGTDLSARSTLNEWKLSLLSAEHSNSKASRLFEAALSRGRPTTTNNTQTVNSNTPYIPRREQRGRGRNRYNKRHYNHRGDRGGGYQGGYHSGNRGGFRGGHQRGNRGGFRGGHHRGNGRGNYRGNQRGYPRGNFRGRGGYQRQHGDDRTNSNANGYGNYNPSQYEHMYQPAEQQQQQRPYHNQPPAKRGKFQQSGYQQQNGYRQSEYGAQKQKPINTQKLQCYHVKNGQSYGGPELVQYICNFNEKGICWYRQDHARCDWHHMCRFCFVIGRHISDKCDQKGYGNVYGYGR